MGDLAALRAIISEIPRGRVLTYGGVARAAGFPNAARLTVRALQGVEGLPWHRVVGAGGRIALTGDPGWEQRLRLEMEGVTFRGGRVRMDRHEWTPRARRPQVSQRPGPGTGRSGPPRRRPAGDFRPTTRG